jgi:hypothetical protein
VEVTTTQADRYDAEVACADAPISDDTPIADDSAIGRFDPYTGKLLASAPRFDPVTGARLAVSHTRVIPAERRVGFLVAQGIWAVLMALVSIGMMRDGFPVVPALFGGFFWFLIGAGAITIISFVSRKIRHLP